MSEDCEVLPKLPPVIVVTPYRNLGPKEGFEPIPTEAVTLPDLRGAARAVVEMLRG